VRQVNKHASQPRLLKAHFGGRQRRQRALDANHDEARRVEPQGRKAVAIGATSFGLGLPLLDPEHGRIPVPLQRLQERESKARSGGFLAGARGMHGMHTPARCPTANDS
jgi:hypothetical protein